MVVRDIAVDILREMARRSGLEDAWFLYDEARQLLMDDWRPIFEKLPNFDLQKLWAGLTGQSGGERNAHWMPESLKKLQPKFERHVQAEMIPAIRQIGKKGSESDGFSGEGMIERLVRLQNPVVHKQEDRKKFHAINAFLKNVTGNNSAEIEIPHERDTINVHMDGKVLPLESLGTGIHEVVILASAATILEGVVVCMEEPELHLNPILQKKLIRYLISSTANQYFITTHSAALMDTPGAEIYHVQLEGGSSVVERVTSDKHRSSVCEDLGYHPSDLLQSNCIIWVEGPSDRIYLNYWIKSLDAVLVEGIHYSIMFYGGRLASHVTGEDLEGVVDNMISLRRLNRRGVIVIDSDREKKGARINDTKSRLKKEFDEGPGFAWITSGREVENYLPAEQIQQAIKSTKPSARVNSSFGQYENTLSIVTKGKKSAQASKVDVARHIVEEFQPDLTRLDLLVQVRSLVKFIRESNPAIHVTST